MPARVLLIVCVVLGLAVGCGASTHKSTNASAKRGNKCVNGNCVTVSDGSTLDSGCAGIHILYSKQRGVFHPNSGCPYEYDCHSHGADAIGVAPRRPSAGRTTKRVFKANVSGGAVLVLTTAADGRITATCR